MVGDFSEKGMTFHNAICDLGSSINIMSKKTYDRLFYTLQASTLVYLQLADQSTYLKGVATYLLVKVRVLMFL